MQRVRGPIECASIAGDTAQASHPAIIDRQKSPAPLCNPRVADWRIVEAKFANAAACRAAANVAQNAKDSVRRGIAIVEEKLCLWSLGIPIQHRTLLRIPGA